MKKILTLGQKDFLSGVSEVSHGNRGGLFFSADGIAPFVSPYRASNEFGLLQTFSAPVNMTGAVVVDVPFAWASEATAENTGYLYIFGNEGNLYVVVLFTNAISNERATSDRISNPAIGLAIYKDKLYYAQLTQIGQCTEATPPFDTSSTWDNDWSGTTGGGSALTSSTYHPLHVFSGRLWVGNSEKIDLISGAAGSETYTTGVLTFDSDYNILCLEDDGHNLVAGMTQNLGDVSIMGKSKVAFWNTYDEYPSREWIIPEANISAMRKMGAWLYAITSGGVYRFSYGSAPTKVVNNVDCNYGRNASVDVLKGELLLVGRRGAKITSYGSPLPGYPKTTFNPFTGFGNGVQMVASTAKEGTIYVGTTDSKLYRQGITSGGATSLAATTNFIELPQKTKIEAIKVIFGKKLASGDSLNIDVSADSGDTATDFGTISFANYGAVRRATIMGSFEAEDLQLVLNYTAGNVKIRRIEVWGTPQPNSLE